MTNKIFEAKEEFTSKEINELVEAQNEDDCWDLDLLETIAWKLNAWDAWTAENTVVEGAAKLNEYLQAGGYKEIIGASYC